MKQNPKVGDVVRLTGVVERVHSINQISYTIIFYGGSDLMRITQSEMFQAEIITPAPTENEKVECPYCHIMVHPNLIGDCYSKPEPTEAWEPKVGEPVKYNVHFDEWIDAEILTISETSMFLTPFLSPNMAYRIPKSNIRPITPEPMTAEQELYDLLSNPKQYKFYQKVLTWHTKHTPPSAVKEVSEPTPTDWDIIKTVQSIYSNANFTVETINESILVKLMELRGTPIIGYKSLRNINEDFEHHFLALQKGGKG